MGGPSEDEQHANAERSGDTSSTVADKHGRVRLWT